jgi:hypothetical protein
MNTILKLKRRMVLAGLAARKGENDNRSMQ